MRKLLIKAAIACCLGVSLAACAPMRAQQQAQLGAQRKAEHDQAYAACNERLPKRVGNMAARANCFAAADETFISLGSRDADLWHVIDAYRLAIAAKIDRGEVSLEDGSLMVAEKNSQLTATADSRQAAAANVAAAERANNAAVAAVIIGVMNANRPQPYVLPMPQQPVNRSVNCTSFGTGNLVSTNCN
jgi:hypothetical protein